MVCVCVCVCVFGKNLLWSQGHANWVVWVFWDEMTKVTTSFEGFFFSPPWAWGRGLGIPPNGRADSTWYVSYSGLKVMGVCTEQHRESAARPPVSSMAVSRQLLGVGGEGGGGTWRPLPFSFWTLALSANPAHRTMPPYILISLSLWVGPLWPADGVFQVCFLHLKTKDIRVSSPWKKCRRIDSKSKNPSRGPFFHLQRTLYTSSPSSVSIPGKGFERRQDFSLVCKMHNPRPSILWIQVVNGIIKYSIFDQSSHGPSHLMAVARAYKWKQMFPAVIRSF